MKKVLLSILLMLLPLLASAETVEIDGIWYNLVTKVQEAEVTKNPNIDLMLGSYSGNVAIPASITYNNIIYTVTTIVRGAFWPSENLESITIPNSVTFIDGNAFGNCSSLKSITIPNSVSTIEDFTFNWCTSLTSVTIPNSVTSISESAFNYCSSLSTITIPNSVETIGENAFRGCSSLTAVNIPNSVTSIGSCVFYGCTALSSVTIPSSVTNISASTFSGCSSLASITIPNYVTSIGVSAFQNCSSLTSFSIPNNVETIGSEAFKYCSSLTSITIGNGVKNIEEHAFGKCDELTDVYCLAEKLRSDYWDDEGLYTDPNAFKDSYPQAMTLHVPAASIESYRSTAPWSTFKAIVPLENGEIPVIQKCATPEISYENGMVKFTCETEGVEFISSVTLADEHSYYDDKIQLSQKYKISVYATKTGYYNSDTTTREIEIKGDNKPIVVGDVDGDGKVNVADHVKLSDIIMNQ